MTGASLNTPYNGISPYETTQIHSDISSQLLQKGYKIILAQTDEEKALCYDLLQTVENIKDFFWNHWRLVGVDEQGKIPIFFIHLKANNAFYRRPISGHSQSQCFKFNNAYVKFPEVVCHEFTHAVVHHLNPLNNLGEEGAINESIADIVGIVMKRSMNVGTDWKIGELRDLSTTFTVRQLGNTEPKYDQNGKTTNDYGHIHRNSCLLSHAFYLASTDLAKHNSDPGDKQLLKIWWDAVINLTEEKSFQTFAIKTIQLGEQILFPIRDAIQRAWTNVGLL